MTRRGFTLVEILVALVIGGIAVATAAAVFAASSDGVRTLADRSDRWTREATGRAWLAQLFAGAEVRNAPGSEFVGLERFVRFPTRYWAEEGWLEPGVVSIELDEGRITTALSAGRGMVLMDSLADASFEYLIRYGEQSPWLREWESGTTLPLAVRLRLTHPDQSADTVLFYIGERG